MVFVREFLINTFYQGTNIGTRMYDLTRPPWRPAWPGWLTPNSRLVLISWDEMHCKLRKNPGLRNVLCASKSRGKTTICQLITVKPRFTAEFGGKETSASRGLRLIGVLLVFIMFLKLTFLNDNLVISWQ